MLKIVGLAGFGFLAAFVYVAMAQESVVTPMGGYWSGNWRGQSADATFSDENGGGSLTVFQNTNTHTTNLHYAIWGNDPTSEVCVEIIDQFGNVITICVFTRFLYDYGWGEIPTGDVQFDPQFAHLVTTTGAGFTSTRCTTDTSGPTPVTTCGPGGPATFDVTWTGNGNYTTAGSGANQQTFGAYTFKSSGVYKGSSAYANGLAMGREMSDAPGELRDTKSRTASKSVSASVTQ